MTTAWQPTLPGIDPDATAAPGATPLLDAAHATLGELERQGLLSSRHTLAVQMVLTLAGGIDRSLARDGKVTVAISQAMRQLQDAYAALPEPVVDEGDPFGTWVAGFGRAMHEAAEAPEREAVPA